MPGCRHGGIRYEVLVQGIGSHGMASNGTNGIRDAVPGCSGADLSSILRRRRFRSARGLKCNGTKTYAKDLKPHHA